MDGIRSLRNSSIRTKRIYNGATLPILEDVYIDKNEQTKGDISHSSEIKKVGIIRPEISCNAVKNIKSSLDSLSNSKVALNLTLDESRQMAEQNVIIDFNEYIGSKEKEIAELKSKSSENLNQCSYSDSPLAKYSSRLKEYSGLKKKTLFINDLVKKHILVIAGTSVAGLLLILIVILQINK